MTAKALERPFTNERASGLDEVRLHCNRSVPSRPHWTTVDSGLPEPICTYRCKADADCREGKEICVDRDCVDVTCAGSIDNGVVDVHDDNTDIGAKATVQCQLVLIRHTVCSGCCNHVAFQFRLRDEGSAVWHCGLHAVDEGKVLSVSSCFTRPVELQEDAAAMRCRCIKELIRTLSYVYKAISHSPCTGCSSDLDCSSNEFCDGDGCACTLRVCDGAGARPGGRIEAGWGQPGRQTIRVGDVALLRCQRGHVYPADDGGAAKSVVVRCSNARPEPEFVEKNGGGCVRNCVPGVYKYFLPGLSIVDISLL